MVQPEVCRQGAEIAGGRKGEGRILGRDDHVAQQRDIRAAGQAVAVHLGDGRLVHVKQGHAVALGALQLPGVVVNAARTAIAVVRGLDPRHGQFAVGAGQVIAGREGPAGAAQDDAVDVCIVISLPQGFIQLGLELEGQGVELFRAVEGDARAPALHFVLNALELTHRVFLLVRMSIGRDCRVSLRLCQTAPD